MEDQQPDSQPETPQARPRNRVRSFLIAVAVVAVASMAVLYGAYRTALQGLPKLDKATDYRPFLPTVIVDIQGTVAAEYGEQRRIVVPFEQIPKHVIDAFLAAEDATFLGC